RGTAPACIAKGRRSERGGAFAVGAARWRKRLPHGQSRSGASGPGYRWREMTALSRVGVR
ncbi:hypothetical protein, partial [Haematobacter missouriensis]|uniref:hypothetical protein n=1 Tax=Haematobacter missouriensis TaxID=366616 RepID=UPI001E41B75B